MFVGLNGVQGCGKSTLVANVAKEMREKHNLNTLVLSLDDLYLTHEKQVELAKTNPENPLVQHRGEPGRRSPSPSSIFRYGEAFHQVVARLRSCLTPPSPHLDGSRLTSPTRHARSLPLLHRLRAPPQKRSLPPPLLRQIPAFRCRRPSPLQRWYKSQSVRSTVQNHHPRRLDGWLQSAE